MLSSVSAYGMKGSYYDPQSMSRSLQFPDLQKHLSIRYFVSIQSLWIRSSFILWNRCFEPYLHAIRGWSLFDTMTQASCCSKPLFMMKKHSGLHEAPGITSRFSTSSHGCRNLIKVIPSLPVSYLLASPNGVDVSTLPADIAIVTSTLMRMINSESSTQAKYLNRVWHLLSYQKIL